MKIHIDTDIGGDLDDLCALAMVLKWPGAAITGVTTVAEENGRRAGYTRHVLDLAGRPDIPAAAGADASEGYFRYPSFGYPPEEENWPTPAPPLPGPASAAVDLLKSSIDQGATIVGIGQYTNFRLLDEKYPGILARADIVLMGGSIGEAPDGYPRWPNEDDYNIQTDVASALHVLTHADPIIIPLAMTAQTALRRSTIPDLLQAGPVARLIAHQMEVFDRVERVGQQFSSYPNLPDDLVNFQHDPLACAIALGWRDRVTIETIPLKIEIRDGWLTEIPDLAGLPRRVVTKIDGDTFNSLWRDIVCGQPG